MCFDDIPEDAEESWPCPNCEEGEITKNKDGNWECSICDWLEVINEND